VIEHVGDLASQRQFAREVARVGRAYWVERPTAGFRGAASAYAVRSLAAAAVAADAGSAFQLVARAGSASGRPADFYIDHYLRDVHLLGPGELRALFPDALILRERLLGVAKSLWPCAAVHDSYGQAKDAYHSGFRVVRAMV